MDSENFDYRVKKVLEAIKLESLLNELNREEKNASYGAEKIDIWHDKVMIRKEKASIVKAFDKDALKNVMDTLPKEYVTILSFASVYREEELMSLLHYYFENLREKEKVV